MTLRQRRRLGGVGETLTRVHADCLEQPVAPPLARLLDRDERLLDEARQDIRDRRRGESLPRADHFGRIELEAAGEGRQPAEEDLLVGLEQVVAPLERCRQRLLPRRCGAAARAQEAEPVVEPIGDRCSAEGAEAAGCQLERERQPVEAEADARDVLGVLVGEREARRRRGGALDEEEDGLVLEQPGRRNRVLEPGQLERGDPEHDLSGDAQRLAARRDDGQSRRRAQQAIRQRRCARDDVLAVVEYEQQRARREEVDHRVERLLRSERTHVERGCDLVRDEAGVGEGASSTSAAPAS